MFVERRYLGERRTVTVTADGRLQLADGRVFATFAALDRALNSARTHVNGWQLLRRADGSPLDSIRTDDDRRRYGAPPRTT